MNFFYYCFLLIIIINSCLTKNEFNYESIEKELFKDTNYYEGKSKKNDEFMLNSGIDLCSKFNCNNNYEDEGLFSSSHYKTICHLSDQKNKDSGIELCLEKNTIIRFFKIY